MAKLAFAFEVKRTKRRLSIHKEGVRLFLPAEEHYVTVPYRRLDSESRTTYNMTPISEHSDVQLLLSYKRNINNYNTVKRIQMKT